MAVDPSMNNDDKNALRRRLNGDDLPTQVVRPSFSDRFLNQPMPGTERAHLDAGMSPARAAAIRAQDIAQPGNVFGIPTARAAPMGGPVIPTQIVRPDYSGAFLRGETGAMTAGQAAAAQAPVFGARMSAALDKAAAAPAAKADFSDVQGGATVGLRRLAPGVSRYALGGDVAGPNATPIYTTRGQHGEAVFTDDPRFAAAQSTGGLRRGEVNADVYANAQENAKTNPNAGFEFSHQSALNQRGLQRDDFQNLDPQATQAALALATAGGTSGEDGLANRMDANLLRARRMTQQQAQEGATSNLDPKTQIALMRAQAAVSQGAERNDIARAGLEETRRARTTAENNSERQDASDFFNQYSKLQQTDPGRAANYLVNAIPTDPKTFDSWSKTEKGRQVLSTYLTDVLQPGAAEADAFGNTEGVAPKLSYSDLSLDDKGRFNGFYSKDLATQIPTTRSWLRRVIGSGPYSQTDNFDPSVTRINPEILKRLKNTASR